MLESGSIRDDRAIDMTPFVRPRQSWLAALLSFFVPGLGQAYLGRWPLGLLLAVPFLLVVGGVAFIALFSMDTLRNQIFSASFLIGIFVLNVALLGWRVFAIVHAGLSESPRPAPGLHPRRATWLTRGGRALLGVLLIAAIGMHAYVAWVVVQLNTTLSQVFEPGAGPPEVNPGDGQEPEGEEPGYRWDGRERVNFLFVGVDEAPGRQASLTDTILALSVDPTARSAVMVSIPRDTGFMPLADQTLYPDGLYPRKINELAAEAAARPEIWCPGMSIGVEDDAHRCGLATLKDTVGLYLGIPIHYHARIDLLGFERLIDAFGGVELCLPGRLVDPQYADPSTGERGLDLPSGCARYDGSSALAYARSRQGWIEMPDGTREPQNDFLRADRQQEILLSLRRELEDTDLLELPSVLDAIGSIVSTDFPRERGGDLASLVPLVTGPDIEREVLGYPEYVDLPADPNANYLLTPRRDSVRAGMTDLLGVETELVGWYLGKIP
jgi:LCP family protein required for cell wall assembly